MREPGEIPLPGKMTVRADGRKLVLGKRPGESARHVLLKAIVWALYLPRYPQLSVEPPRRGRYRPDLVALDDDGDPLFWAECGETGRAKTAALVRTLPTTHLVFAKQVARIDPYRAMIGDALAGARRSAPVELLNLPPDADRLLLPTGEIAVTFDDVQLVTFPNEGFDR